MRQVLLLMATFLTLVWCQPVSAVGVVQSALLEVEASQPSQLLQLAASTNKTKKKRLSCSPDEHFDGNLGKCVPCKPDFHEEVQADDNGEDQNICVADLKKPKKQTTKSCPEGQTLQDGKCKTSEFPEIEQCPEGQNLDPSNGQCFSCSHNDHFDDALGKCVPCKQGFHVAGDECVAD